MQPKKIPLHKKIELSHNTQKPFPFSDEAEKNVLGALLLESGAMVRIADKLTPKHFYNERQGQIFKAMKDLFSKSQPIDILTVFQRCELLSPKSKINAYELSVLTNNLASAAHIEAHAEIITTKWAQREIMRIGNKMLYLASSPSFDVPDMLGAFGSELMELNRQAIPSKVENTNDILTRIMDSAMTPTNSIKGISTGIAELDNITEGLEKGDFVVIGGRPGMGKTALLTTIAQNIAFNQNKSVAFISYEMTKERIYQRIISLRAEIDSRKIGKEKLEEHELTLIQNVVNEIYSNKNFNFINGRGLDVVGIRAKLLALKQDKDIKAVFIDYLQRIPILKTMGRKSTHDAIGANTKALSELALELNIPIVIPCQLGRKSTEGNPRPTLTSLRDSGKIEDDAVKVWFIHRPEYYGIDKFENDESTIGKAEIIGAKNRNGEIGVCKIGFNAPTTKFYTLEGKDDEPEIKEDSNLNYFDDDVPF